MKLKDIEFIDEEFDKHYNKADLKFKIIILINKYFVFISITIGFLLGIIIGSLI